MHSKGPSRTWANWTGRMHIRTTHFHSQGEARGPNQKTVISADDKSARSPQRRSLNSIGLPLMGTGLVSRYTHGNRASANQLGLSRGGLGGNCVTREPDASASPSSKTSIKFRDTQKPRFLWWRRSASGARRLGVFILLQERRKQKLYYRRCTEVISFGLS